MTLREWVAGALAPFDMIGIIDDWENRDHGFLPVDEAVEKFGDCIVKGSAYDGELSRYTKPDGKHPTAWDVWLAIPGMHLGYISGDRLTIPGDEYYDKEANVRYVIFKGKRSGRNITVVQNGDGPYDIYVDSPDYIVYITDFGKNPRYEWRGKKLTAGSQAAIWALRDEVWEYYDKEDWK